MSDDRDLDELLESLDALLREGESHNDDAEEAESPAVSAPSTEKKAAPSPKPASAPQDKAPPVEAAEAPEDQADAATGSTDEELPHFLTDAPGVDESSVPDDEDDSDAGVAEAPVQRVVLTEDMLVDNHQERLPLKQGKPKAAASGGRPPESGELSLSEAQMRQLAELVRRDVTAHLKANLPQWIEQSIKRHLQTQSDKTKEQK